MPSFYCIASWRFHSYKFCTFCISYQMFLLQDCLRNRDVLWGNEFSFFLVFHLYIQQISYLFQACTYDTFCIPYLLLLDYRLKMGVLYHSEFCLLSIYQLLRAYDSLDV